MANNNLPDNIAFGIICEHQGHYPAEFLHKSATNFFLAFTITNKAWDFKYYQQAINFDFSGSDVFCGHWR
jgi:hypothetical protein